MADAAYGLWPPVVPNTILRVLLALRGKRDTPGPDRSIRRAAPALPIAGVWPLPVLLATDAPAGARGPWGVGCIAAALAHAFPDTLRDTRAAQGRLRPGGCRAGPEARA